MRMDGKTLRFTLAVAALSCAIFLLLLWQPVRQVRLHQRHLLRAVEKRDWTKAGRFIDAQYHDRWEHDKENVLPEAAQVFNQFFVCNLQAEERTVNVADGAGVIATRLTLGGSGSAIAEYAKERVNSLREPFTFKWIHRSWKPWDWALIEVDQPQLEMEGSL
jgi:hypothetical protein